MNKTIVVTGSASGMGAATSRRLQNSGHRVIGVDLREAEVIADLATPQGRSDMVTAVGDLAPDGIDGIATLEGLRPLLAGSHSPRAVAISSTAALLPCDQEMVDACLAGDEPRAVALAARGMEHAYPASKQALARLRLKLMGSSTALHRPQKTPPERGIFWRRGWDSNPRYGCP